MDGTWLSGSESVTVGDVQIPPLNLTIAEPGGPALVRVTGQRTHRLTRLVIDRPTGPMADRLWPESLTPDGAGAIRIPALESGRHVVRIGQVERVIEVPSIAVSKGQPVEIEISVAPRAVGVWGAPGRSIASRIACSEEQVQRARRLLLSGQTRRL